MTDKIGDENSEHQNSIRCISLAKGRESSSNYQRRPTEGWIKMNTDAAVDIVDDQAVVGCVFHLDQGDWLFGSSRSTGNCSVLNARLWAICDALRRA
ncbi:hypothetical protein F3Y22_tig00112740pilonHSYRG00032 [Hibiscus syriacus]|uniref:RNase H type-1 domain-containing protein n=1 Tax=Hibiscus syriacus TaxID=106335 RepID=A0A6A2Y030_HIBSY|nr:hypothetical protein F3Y22_tig00112740pilonHSYRG00032 [Hibiscus syriacus]